VDEEGWQKQGNRKNLTTAPNKKNRMNVYIGKLYGVVPFSTPLNCLYF
jgi:hypothetical protein